MPSTLPPLVRFANFEVDLRAGELRRNGGKIRLQEQPFLLLTVLMESAGEVVSREDLRKRLWPADTFVDFDHRLAVAVNKLRDALRDSVEKPRFVETVGRRGYRFLGQLESTDSSAVDSRVGIDQISPALPQPAEDAQLPKLRTPRQTRSRATGLVLFLSAALVICLGVIALSFFFTLDLANVRLRFPAA